MLPMARMRPMALLLDQAQERQCVCVWLCVRPVCASVCVCVCARACLCSLRIRSERCNLFLKSPNRPSDSAAPFLASSGAQVLPDLVSQIQRFGYAKCGQILPAGHSHAVPVSGSPQDWQHPRLGNREAPRFAGSCDPEWCAIPKEGQRHVEAF